MAPPKLSDCYSTSWQFVNADQNATGLHITKKVSINLLVSLQQDNGSTTR